VGLVLALAGCGDHTGPSMNDAGPVSDATPTDADGPGDDAQVPACTSDDDCDNDVPCQARERCDLTTHTCEPTDPLDDGDACAPDRICDDGLCVLEVPTECTTDEDCDDGNSCNGVDFCDTDTGTCQVTTCNDGDPCTDNVCNTDGPCDFLFIDQDGDGYAPAVECTDPALKGGDCDDTKSWVNPGAEEVCDLHFDGRLEEVDNNCDGYDGFAPESGLPNLYFRDRDEDSYGDPNEGVPCPLEGYVRGDTPTTGSPGAPPRRDFDCFDGPNPDSVGADVHPSQGQYFEPPYCVQGAAAYDEVDGWFCDDTESAATPSWDYNCNNMEELLWTETGGFCACSSGERLDCEFPDSCSPPSWSSQTAPDCGVTATWSTCDLVSGFCQGGFETRTQRCR
jgi:hypothetical protein